MMHKKLSLLLGLLAFSIFFSQQGRKEQLQKQNSELKKQIADKQLVILENNTCQHELDTENGFWKNSKYGGGLSWHYKCKKCGIEFDTGDYYD